MKERIKNFYPQKWDDHCKEQALLLTPEKRQEFVNYMWDEHLSVGEAADKSDLNFDEASGIMMMQIKSHLYFDNKVKV